MSNQSEARLRQHLAEVVKRASVDSAFRVLALQDAAAAFAKVAGEALPAGLRVRFLEPAEAKAASAEGEIVIPLGADGEISEGELENLSGGYLGAYYERQFDAKHPPK